MDSYFVNNLRLGYSWKIKPLQAVELTLLINNLFNTEYETNGYNWSYYWGGNRVTEKRYFPQAGRNEMVSLTLKL
ncbi:MAG: TonB-dependent receptor [Paludibacteraceae bacterium]